MRGRRVGGGLGEAGCVAHTLNCEKISTRWPRSVRCGRSLDKKTVCMREKKHGQHQESEKDSNRDKAKDGIGGE